MKPVVQDLADRWEAAWSGRDQHAFHAVCASDVFYEDPVAGAPLDGPQAIGIHAGTDQAYPRTGGSGNLSA